MRGITVILYTKSQTGIDDFGAPVFTEDEPPTLVENVLVGQPTGEEIINELQLNGKRLAYVLAIPKGDTHEWYDNDVVFFGERFHVYAPPTQGIDHLVPTAWNKKVKVERYG